MFFNVPPFLSHWLIMFNCTWLYPFFLILKFGLFGINPKCESVFSRLAHKIHRSLIGRAIYSRLYNKRKNLVKSQLRIFFAPSIGAQAQLLISFPRFSQIWPKPIQMYFYFLFFSITALRQQSLVKLTDTPVIDVFGKMSVN